MSICDSTQDVNDSSPNLGNVSSPCAEAAADEDDIRSAEVTEAEVAEAAVAAAACCSNLLNWGIWRLDSNYSWE